jgi:biopolymer transport protein ExbB
MISNLLFPMKKFLIISLLIPFLSLSAQQTNRAASAAKTTEGDLTRALAELSQLRNDIAAAKIPLAQEINALENEKIELTAERDEVVELASGANRVKAELQDKENDLSKVIDYLHTAMGNYISQFLGNGIHVAEVQLYRDVAKAALDVQDMTNVPLKERLQKQVDAMNASFDRLYKAVGGYKYPGECELNDGSLVKGNFAIIGPIGIFSDGPASAGLVGINPLSAGPKLEKIVRIEKQMADVTTTGQGTIFLDTKLGQAQDILNLSESVPEHIKKGGLVMYPIIILAIAAFIISVFKVFEIASVRRGKVQDLNVILDHLQNKRQADALAYARGIKGPVGSMLVAALEHIDADEDLIEEILYEKMLSTQPKLERFLPFISVTAATAPLLGLLGTVTGMINTFKLITIFGTGDATRLSSGISEALITTEFGLIIAIPTLIAHTMLSRMSKSVLGSMERTAVGFVNGLPRKN